MRRLWVGVLLVGLVGGSQMAYGAPQTFDSYANKRDYRTFGVNRNLVNERRQASGIYYDPLPTASGADAFSTLYPEVQIPESNFPQPEPAPQTYDDGSGSGAGGGAVAAPSMGNLADSPEWMAFLNSLGLEQSQFQADIDRQRGVAQNSAVQQAGDIAATGVGERRNVAGTMETRGMARSGQFIRGLADQRAAEGRRQAGVQTALAGTLSGYESSLAQKLMDINARKAQQELQMRAAGYQ